MGWIIAGSILLGLLLIFLILSIAGYRVAFHSPIKGQNNDFSKIKYVNYNGISQKVNAQIDQLLKIPYEDLYIKSYDGLKLHAYFYKSEGSNEYVIFFHGYRRTARRNFCGLTLDLLKEHKNVILVDQRAHGQSQGHQTTFGIKESRDVVDWTNYLIEHFGEDNKFVIDGVSLGATAILMAADKIDERVKIIVDSPYYSVKDVFIKTIKHFKLPAVIFYPPAAFAAIMFCHVSLKSDISTAIKNSKNKMLIIHSRSDKLVSYKISERFALESDGRIQLGLFDDVEHGFAYLRQTEKYREIYFNFLKEE